jgi:hypothetical protein
MGFNSSGWGTITSGQPPIVTGIIWSPYNADKTGGSDQGAQINLAFAQTDGFSTTSFDQTKQINPDGTVAYFVSVSCASQIGVNEKIDFGLQGGGF